MTDSRYTIIAKELYDNEENKNQAKFLVELQTIMMKHGVAKQDACGEAFKIPVSERHL